MKTKSEYRNFYREKRREIPPARREAAHRKLIEKLHGELMAYSLVLSFASKEDEIDMHTLNQKLAEEGRLVLPRVDDKRLSIYHVLNYESDLKMSMWGILEPDELKCDSVHVQEIGCALVPGIVFDANHHRVGYGVGHYDRFLPMLFHCPHYGVAYKEQKSEKLLPIEPHDVSLSKVLFF